MTTFAIVGAGNAGCAFAAHLNLLGCETRLYDVVDAQLASILANGNRIELGGDAKIAGVSAGESATAHVHYVGDDLAQTIAGASVIMCTTPAHTHRAVANDLAKHIQPGQIVVLNPGRTCGAIEVANVLRDQGISDDVIVVEAQTLLYACRREGASVHVFGVKDRVDCAAAPQGDVERFLAAMHPLMPQFVRAEQGIWETSLNNIGMLFHPAPTLMNLGRMESGNRFDYYIDGMSPTIANLVERIDDERCRVAAAMQIEIPSAREWLKSAYAAEGANLYEAVQNNTAYHGIQAPSLKGIDAKRGLRYVIEDVPTGLVPVSELGNKFDVPTPTMDLVIELASTIYDRDFRGEGRTLERLGMADLSAEQLMAL